MICEKKADQGSRNETGSPLPWRCEDDIGMVPDPGNDGWSGNRHSACGGLRGKPTVR